MDDIEVAVAAELSLLRPEVRSDAQLVDALLDPEFTEVGASGRWWDRPAIVAALVAGEITDPEASTASEVTGVRLGPELVHITYVSQRAGGVPVRRSSIWRRTDGRWRLYYHQGTPTS
jgi:hypothetical protein